MKMKDNDYDISLLTDDYLGQLAMVLGLTCVHDPKDYFGYNLIDELYNRAQTAMNSEVIIFVLYFLLSYLVNYPDLGLSFDSKSADRAKGCDA